MARSLPIPPIVPDLVPPLFAPTTLGDAVIEFTFTKVFEGEDFIGTIIRYRSEDDLYHAVYEDGDAEDFSAEELTTLTPHPPLPSQLPLSQQPPPT